MKITSKSIIEELLSIPEQISMIENRLYQHKTSIDNYKSKMSIIELNAKDTINTATTKDGKKLYPNDDARKTALNLYLAEDTKYNSYIEEIKKTESLINSDQIEIGLLNNKQRNIKSILDYLKSDKSIEEVLS